MYVLSRIAASAWGAIMENVRQVYLAVVRPAMSYGAALWHSPKERRQKGPTAKLQKHHSEITNRIAIYAQHRIN
jgi:hypothetical protein